MDSEVKGWLIFGVIGLLTVAVTPASCVMYQSAKVVEAIKAGADPIGAYCAVKDAGGSTPGCVAYIVQPRNK